MTSAQSGNVDKNGNIVGALVDRIRRLKAAIDPAPRASDVDGDEQLELVLLMIASGARLRAAKAGEERAEA